MIHLDPIGTHLYYTKPSKTWSTQKLQAVQRAWIPSFQPDWYLKFAAVFCDGRIANGFSIVQVDTSRHTTWSNDQERTRHPTMKKTTPTNIPFHCWAWEISKKKKGFHGQQGVIISPYFTGLQGRCRSWSLWPFRKQRICLAPGAKVMGFLRETSKINLEGRLKTVQIELFGINFTSTWVKIRFMFPWKIGSNSTQRRVEEWRLLWGFSLAEHLSQK